MHAPQEQIKAFTLNFRQDMDETVYDFVNHLCDSRPDQKLNSKSSTENTKLIDALEKHRYSTVILVANIIV